MTWVNTLRRGSRQAPVKVGVLCKCDLLCYNEIRIGTSVSSRIWYVGGIMKNLLLLASVLTLASCGDSRDSKKVSGIFSDSAVTSFQQTSGIAKIDKSQKVLNFVLPTAYAVTGNISCIAGQPISFTMDALGNMVTVNSVCTDVTTIDKDIRVGLLKSMTGFKMRRTITEATYNGNDAFLNFSGGFQFDVGYDVPRNHGLPCKETYTFHADGTITITAADQTAQVAISDSTACGGAFSDQIAFQFANGYLEFDSSGQRNFSKTHVMNDMGVLISAYQRFEVCNGVNTISADALPTDVGAGHSNLSTLRDAVVVAGGVIPCN